MVKLWITSFLLEVVRLTAADARPTELRLSDVWHPAHLTYGACLACGIPMATVP